MILARRAAAGHARRRGEPPAAGRPLSAFVRRCGIPFFNTQMGKGAVTGGSNLYMGTAALSERDYVHEAIDRADLIIAIGHDTVEKPPFLMGHERPEGDPCRLHAGDGRAGVLPACRGGRRRRRRASPLLADRLEGKLAQRLGLAASAGGDPRADLAERATEDRFPLTPQRIVHDVRAGDAGRTASLPRQRHVQDLVRPQLPHPASPTRCCSTTRWRRWARACRRR